MAVKPVTFLATDGHEILWSRLERLFDEATTLRIASAFLGGGDEITDWVEARPKRRVQVLLRLECPTNPQTVRRLMDHPQVEVRAADSVTMPFHEKHFMPFSAAGRPLGAYVGSANWTQGGLKRNQEAGVWVTDRRVLAQIHDHFASSFRDGMRITKQKLAEYSRQFNWEMSYRKRPRHGRERSDSAWNGLRANDDRYLIKQNGTGTDALHEGSKRFFEELGNDSSQTVSRIPSTFEEGLPILLCRIARRRDADQTPDRMIYGRGIIADIDPKRWRLPRKYVDSLSRRRGITPEHIRTLKSWPEVFWIDPAEAIDYKRTDTFLWLSDFVPDPVFQGGYRWIGRSEWEAINSAFDQRIATCRSKPLDRQGIWWNYYLDITDEKDRHFMSRDKMERMNLDK